MKIKDAYAYSMLAPTSMGIRITPFDRQPVSVSSLYQMHAVSAESNVLTVSASLGLRTKVLTAFVKDSEIAFYIKGDLQRRNIEFEGAEIPQGGPWGYRHQFNIADAGKGMRGPRVLNDRAGEVGKTLNVKDFDLARLFEREGAALLHISGLIAAISAETGEFCLKLTEKAKASGTLVSFDLNYRASFWKNRESELRELFTMLAQKADILIGNEEDYQLALGIEGPQGHSSGLCGQIDGFKQMIGKAQKLLPNALVFANTLREVVNADEHLWGALMLANGEWHIVEPRSIPVHDRIGGGDAFVGGLLYGMLKSWPAEKCLQFGWATGAFVVTVSTYYCQPFDESQIWSIYEGNARVKR
ncbi:MAG: sugar kinase [Treponema sp.]|jgi:2-dehydro-3-deoxygluconokinase|nr:sugar kinase [Treponema sp.]